jgi:hypothetical protein
VQNRINTQKSKRITTTLGLLISLLSISACSENTNAANNDGNLSQKLISVNTEEITLSGLSSGGYMATQFHLSHAEIINGVGIIAAGPYNCARGSITTVFAECVNTAPPAAYVESLFTPFANETTSNTNKTGSTIAPKASLQADKVWLFHGTLDERIHANVAAGLYQQYQRWIPADNLVFVNDKPFAHLFPTEAFGSNCDKSEPPFIGNCDYDAAGIMLSHIFGNLHAKQDPVTTYTVGSLLRFEQATLSGLSMSGNGMADEGFIYFPDTCKNGEPCDLHVSFHGCNQSISNVDDAYARNTGINQWAASNNIIVLYPQVKKSSIMPMNPQACWDWWGYTDTNYANKEGPQIQAVYNMVNNIADYLAIRVSSTK